MQVKEYWSNQDIMSYVGCGKNKASQIRKEAIIKFDGLNPVLPRLVKKEAVLKVLEVNRDAKRTNN